MPCFPRATINTRGKIMFNPSMSAFYSTDFTWQLLGSITFQSNGCWTGNAWVQGVTCILLKINSASNGMCVRYLWCLDHPLGVSVLGHSFLTMDPDCYHLLSTYYIHSLTKDMSTGVPHASHLVVFLLIGTMDETIASCVVVLYWFLISRSLALVINVWREIFY